MLASMTGAATGMAALTAISAIGGFPRPPDFWIKLSDNILFQGLAVWILVTQAGQFEKNNIWGALIITIIFMMIVFGLRYLEGSWKPSLSGSTLLNYFKKKSNDDIDPPDSQPTGEHYFNPRYFAGAKIV